MVQVPCRPDPKRGLPNAMHQSATEGDVARRCVPQQESSGYPLALALKHFATASLLRP